MKAIRLHAYNEDMRKAIKLDECDVPVPDDNEILIQVYSAALNPVDWKISMGYLAAIFKQTLPQVLGYDFAGIVVGVGSAVSNDKNNGLKVGTRVAGMLTLLCNNGCFAEYVTCSPENVAILNDKLSFDMGAGIPLVTLTSYQALTNYTNIGKNGQGKNQKILVLGGSSSTGMAALQIARNLGVGVIATTSSQEELCKKHGATKVYNYKDKNAPAWYDDLKNGEFDIIYDCVGKNDSWQKAQYVLKKEGGHFITIAGNPVKPDSKDIKDENEKNTYKFFIIGKPEGIRDLFEMVNHGKLDVQIDEDSPYTLDKVFDMFQKSIDRTAHGKLILRFCQEGKK